MIRAIALWCLTMLAIGTAYADEPKRKILIDDDGFGIMHLMLLQSTDVDVIGITTVSGNMWVNRVTAKTLRGLEIAHRPDIPVAQGATYPLLNSETLTERWEALYGKLTWKGAWMKRWVEDTLQSTPDHYGPDDPVALPEGNPQLRPTNEIAANLLIRMVHTYPSQITIVACGPLTNIALAQRLDPQFASLAGELVYMGGSLNPRQKLNTASARQFAREFDNSPRREFNARFDPEAASIVSRSPWRKLTVIPVDPSTGTELTVALLQRLSKAAPPDLKSYIAAMEPGFPLWDEIAAGYVLDPAIVREAEDLYVDYNTQFSAGYGDLLSWREHYQPDLGERKAHVVRAVDAVRLEGAMVSALGQGAPHGR